MTYEWRAVTEPGRESSLLTRMNGAAFWAPMSVGGAIGFALGWSKVQAQTYLELDFHRLALRTVVTKLTQGLGIGFLVFLTLLACGVLWHWRLRRWTTEAIAIEILDRERVLLWLRRLVMIFVLVGLLWWLNREFLPYRYSPVSLAVDLAFVLLGLALDRALKKFVPPWRTAGAVVLGVALLGNLTVWIDRMINVPTGPNVLLISLDTLRSDALGLNGGPPGISPTIDALARGGMDFKSAMAPSPWTLPSHMSLFTSLYPNEHELDTPAAWSRSVRLAPPRVTLAEVLANENYRTLAVTDGGFVSSVFGFDDGFERYVEEGSGEKKLNLAREWIGSVDSPFFLFFHTYAVHAPYTETWYLRETADEIAVPVESIDRLDARLAEGHLSPKEMERILIDLGLYEPDVSKALYLGGVREADRIVAQLLEALDEAGKRRETLIVLTSDHGEEFAEHNAAFFDAHADSLFEATLNVPLIIAGSEFEAGSTDTPVSLVDVAPTVLELLGLASIGSWRGKSVANDADTDNGVVLRPVFAQTSMSDKLLAVRVGNWKLIENRSCRWLPCEESKSLFDLATDPSESSDLSNWEEQMLANLEALIDVYSQRTPADSRGKKPANGLDENVRRRLEALGYIQDE